MRVSDQDYSLDLRSFHLALRMLRHAARLNTVCAWTGFTEERVRNLSRSHRRQQPRRDAPRRGPSPRTLAPLVATASLKSEVAALAGLCRVLAIIPDPPLPDSRRRLPGVALGEQLCAAYEFFRESVPYARVSFEQLVFLVFAVAEAKLCSLDRCVDCGAVILLDHLSLGRRICVPCQRAERRAITESDTDAPDAQPNAEEPPGFQRRLFE